MVPTTQFIDCCGFCRKKQSEAGDPGSRRSAGVTIERPCTQQFRSDGTEPKPVPDIGWLGFHRAGQNVPAKWAPVRREEHAPPNDAMINDLWYKNAVIYCLSVGTYMDANGDGIGDFQGLMRRLDYLHGLGVTAIWLMPFQTSPYLDDGYDVSDYYSVDPRYGTLGDFVEFTHGAKQRGIRVLIDLVVNHTSDQHRWFQEARRDPN